MLKILRSSQIREADAFTIMHEPIASIDLMERAAKQCLDWIQKKFTKESTFYIFCGFGNNGGDGFALCRLLLQNDYNARAIILENSEKMTADCAQNFKLLKRLSPDSILPYASNLFDTIPKKNSILVDALFGSGLNRSLEEPYPALIQAINDSGLAIISIDIPSGMFAEFHEAADASKIIKANYTLSFQFPKLTFLLPDFGNFVGELHVLPIGLHPEFCRDVPTSHYLIEEADCKAIARKRNTFAHKGNFGHALLIAGSEAKMGAAVLSTHACLRSGSGLVTALVPPTERMVIQCSLPEAMLMEETKLSANTDLSSYTAIGIGPGLGTTVAVALQLKLLIQNCKQALVLDADALNILAENKTWLGFFQGEVVLTPHVKEFERLTEKAKNAYHRLQLAKEFSIKNKVYLVLKGKYTCISCPDGNQYFNPTGNAGMAKGGSGDVLTGIITGLLAQNYSAKEACILGTYLHGLAGDIAAYKLSQEALLASDIILNLPDAYHYLNRNV